MTQQPATISVLLADDCSTVSTVLRSILRKAGYSVVGIAPDGRTALKLIDQLNPDIVSLDLQMPIMSGLEVLQSLNDSPSSTAAVVVSADTDKEIVRQSIDLGALGYITKPFNEERVISVFGQVASIINRRRNGADASAGTQSSAKRAIIIDNSAENRRQLKLILEGGGYIVLDQAEDGMTGLIAVEKYRPDFVCHAVDLTDIDGLQVLACLHAAHPDLPIIIVSSHNDSETITRAVRGGVRGYILKPLNPKTVLSAICSALSNT
ncbi:MAG: response regulator [Nitrosomonas ureae]